MLPIKKVLENTMFVLIFALACAPEPAPNTSNDRFEAEMPQSEDEDLSGQSEDEELGEEEGEDTNLGEDEEEIVEEEIVEEEIVEEDLGYTQIDDCTFYVYEEGEGYVDLRENFCTPATIYGELDAAGNDGENYIGDVDYLLIEPPEDGTYRFELHWTADSSDYDLSVIDAYTLEVLDYSYYDEPEFVEMSLTIDTAYYLVIGGWEGQSGSWTLKIE